MESLCTTLLADPDQWPLAAFTFSDLLACLPGSEEARPFPKAFQEKREILVHRALLFLEKKSQVTLPTDEKIIRAIQHSLRCILESDRHDFTTDWAALTLQKTFYDPALTPYFIKKLDCIHSGFAADCRDLLVAHPTPALILEIQNILAAKIKTEVLDPVDRPSDQTSSIPRFCQALRGMMGNDEKFIAFLKSVDPMPLDLAVIRTFRLASGDFLDGRGVCGWVFDAEFDKHHIDFGPNIFLPEQKGLDEEHGTLVVSTWAGRAWGIAPQTQVFGQPGSGTTVDFLKLWTSALLRAAENAKTGKPHPRIFCLSVGPCLEDLKKPEVKNAYDIVLPQWHAACANAFAHNIVILISAGNQRENDAAFSVEGGQLQPFSLNPHVLRVGACSQKPDQSWHMAHYSARGGSIFSPAFSAPTNRLAAACNTFEIFPGTSCSTPVAAAIVSLMLQANPHLTAADVFEILTATALPLADAPISQQGAGMIQPAAALAECLRRISPEEARRFEHHVKPNIQGRQKIGR